VHGFDQRGWGRSVHRSSDKGRTGGTTQVVAEVAAFIRSVLACAPASVPVFVLGHSMGGGEVATLMCDGAYEADVIRPVRGWLLESPFIGWPAGEEPSALKIFVGRLAGRFLPHRQLVHKIPPEKLSRDPEVQRSLREDKLCHDTGTLEGLAALLDRTEALLKGKAAVCAGVRALWVGHGTRDFGTSYEASSRWFKTTTGNVADREFKTYEGWYHQLHSDTGREEFYKDVGEWILKRCDLPEKKEAAVVKAFKEEINKDEVKKEGAKKEEPTTTAEASNGEPVKQEAAAVVNSEPGAKL
jgi:acylglycerol lipase